jgi:hypothetical protein
MGGLTDVEDSSGRHRRGAAIRPHTGERTRIVMNHAILRELAAQRQDELAARARRHGRRAAAATQKDRREGTR